jgi:hypothetical protein
VQEKAIECGLLKEVAYDPAKHGESEYDCDPGDPWYEYSDALKRMLKTPSPETPPT